MTKDLKLSQHLRDIKDGQSDNFIITQTNNYSFVSNITVISSMRLVKVDIKNIAFCIIIEFGSFYDICLRHFTFKYSDKRENSGCSTRIFSNHTFEAKRIDLPDFEVAVHNISGIKKVYHRYASSVNINEKREKTGVKPWEDI